MIFIAVFFLSTIVNADPLSDAWNLARETDNVWIWKHQSNPEFIGSLQSQKRAKIINWNKIKTKDFFKDLTEKKIKLLNLIGISAWNARTYTWNTEQEYHELAIEGDYVNSNGQKVLFQEVHLFKKFDTYQILVTAPAKEKIDRKVAGEFIKSVKQMVTKDGK